MTFRRKPIEIEVVSGVEGPSIYIAGFRIAGPKPWGGGRIIHKWRADPSDFRRALAEWWEP
jgi:hypothetical protein